MGKIKPCKIPVMEKVVVKRFALIVFVLFGFMPLVGIVLQIINYDWIATQEWYHSQVFLMGEGVFLISMAALYIYVIGKNGLISNTEKTRWRVLVFFFSPITMPMYNFKYLIPHLKAQNKRG